MKKNYAFTLIELLIAVSIFSVVMLSIYSAFQTGILSYRKVDSALQTYQAARITLNRLESDLKNSFAYNDAGGSRFSGTQDSLDFFSVIDYYKEDKINTNVCRIKYAWDQDKKVLERICYTGLDALTTGIQQEAAEICSDVEKIIFEYAYPAQEGEFSLGWQDSWPVKKDENDLTQQEAVPLAVKITLLVAEKGKAGEQKLVEFKKIISLPLGESFLMQGGAANG